MIALLILECGLFFAAGLLSGALLWRRAAPVRRRCRACGRFRGRVPCHPA